MVNVSAPAQVTASPVFFSLCDVSLIFRRTVISSKNIRAWKGGDRDTDVYCNKTLISMILFDYHWMAVSLNIA